MIPKRYVIDHKNDNKIDDRLSNLQLLTPRENTKYHQNFKHQRSEKREVKRQSILQPIKSHSI